MTTYLFSSAGQLSSFNPCATSAEPENRDHLGHDLIIGFLFC
jgi:hypothetical protein